MTSPAMTAETIELLQALIRNGCVNDGTPSSGFEHRNADTAARVPRRRRARRGALRADPGPGVARRPDRGPRPDRADACA